MSQNLKNILKFLLLITLSVPFVWFFGDLFSELYIRIYHPVGSWLGGEVSGILGFPAAYLFFIFLTIPVFLPKLNKFIYFILLIPSVYFDYVLFDHVFISFFPYFFAVLGWCIGYGIKKSIIKK